MNQWHYVALSFGVFGFAAGYCTHAVKVWWRR